MSKVRAAPLVVTVELGVSGAIRLADEGGDVVVAESGADLQSHGLSG